MNNKIIDAEIDARTDPKGGKNSHTREKWFTTTNVIGANIEKNYE